jgi:hypothetical protein
VWVLDIDTGFSGALSTLIESYAADDADLITVDGCPDGFAPPSPPPSPPVRRKKAKKNLEAATGGDLTAEAPPDAPSVAFHTYVDGKVKARTPTFAQRFSPRLLIELSECSSRGIVAPEAEAVCTLASRAGLSTRPLDAAHVGAHGSADTAPPMDSKGWAAEVAKSSNKLFHPVP